LPRAEISASCLVQDAAHQLLSFGSSRRSGSPAPTMFTPAPVRSARSAGSLFPFRIRRWCALFHLANNVDAYAGSASNTPRFRARFSKG